MNPSVQSTNALPHPLSPRRRANAERMEEYLRFRGKIFLTESDYRDIYDRTELDRCATDRAIQDLYALGVIEQRIGGIFDVVALRRFDPNAAAARPAEVPAASGAVVSVQWRKGGKRNGRYRV